MRHPCMPSAILARSVLSCRESSLEAHGLRLPLADQCVGAGGKAVLATAERRTKQEVTG